MKGHKLLSCLSFINPKYIQEAEINRLDKADKKHPRHSLKTLMLIAAVLATATILMGAAAYTRWSTTMQARYNPSEGIKQQAEKSGLSAMLEETKGAENPNEVLSITDQGITVTAVQTIADEYGAELTFRIEGFELPEGRFPYVWPIVSINGSNDFYNVQSGAFFDGITKDKQGKSVYLDGTPVQEDADGSLILRYAANDGSLEYTHHISFQETDGRYLGKEIQVQFAFIGIQSMEKAGPGEPIVEGDWTLKWTLSGTDSSITITPNAEIGDSGVVLLDAKLGQRTISTRYRVKDYWEGWDQLVELPQAICGVRMKDGRQHTCVPSASGFEDQENMIYFVDSAMFDAILDLSQVESLMFYKGREKDSSGAIIRTYYYIPISGN